VVTSVKPREMESGGPAQLVKWWENCFLNHPALRDWKKVDLASGTERKMNVTNSPSGREFSGGKPCYQPLLGESRS